ncbi:MAG TPA: response regulator [Burkholderiales bacterium]|nr:response regulator [Burkholderiales bacterium]
MTDTLPTLLIVSAVPEDIARYRDDLQKEYTLLDAGNVAQGLALCQHTKPECILLDYKLPDADGLSALASLLANTMSCAIVVATDIDDIAIAVQSLKSGACDYLLKKDLTASRLRHALRNALNGVALKHQLQEYRAALLARNRELEAALAALQETSTPGPASTRQPPSAALRRILVVDDNRDNADSLSMMLDTLGNDVYTAYDGAGAIETAERVKPDIVLLDVGMATVNGRDVASYVRQQSWGRCATLIALTARDQEKNRLQSQAAGFDYHLVKPVHPDMFVKILAELDTVGDAPTAR